MKEIAKKCEGQCPKCNSDDIEYMGSYLEDDYYTYECICEDCGCQFNEWYALHYVESNYTEAEDNA